MNTKQMCPRIILYQVRAIGFELKVNKLAVSLNLFIFPAFFPVPIGFQAMLQTGNWPEKIPEYVISIYNQ